MAQIPVDIGGYQYMLACRDGEEERLRRLADYVDAKVTDLNQALGRLSENRMLLMAALLVVDELFELREGGAGVEPGADALIEKITARMENFATRLEDFVPKA